MRCPACNANRTAPHQMGKDKSGNDMIGRLCAICGAHWLGELFRNKDLQNDPKFQVSEM